MSIAFPSRLYTATLTSSVLNDIVSDVCRFAGLDSTGEIPDDVTMALVKVK